MAKAVDWVACLNELHIVWLLRPRRVAVHLLWRSLRR